MTEEEWQAIKELDEAAARAGGYVSYLPNIHQHIDHRGLIAYCKEKGIEPLDMTIREYNQFVTFDT